MPTATLPIRFCILASVLLFAINSVTGQVNLSSGLVANYPFTGNSNDLSGNGHHAIQNGGVALSSDRFGNANSAYQLDGINGYLSVSDADGAFSTPAFSLSIWFYTERDDRLQMAVAKRAFDASNVSEFGLNIQSGPAVRTFIVRNNRNCNDPVGGSDYQSTAIPYVTFCKFKWYHVVVSFSNGIEKIYVDGQLLSTATASFPERSDCRSQLRFGVWWSGDPNWFQGKLDDIRWYSRELSSAEVQALYQSPLPPPPQPNCPTCVLPQGSLSSNNICAGQTASIAFTASSGTAPFTIQFSDGTNTFSQSISSNSGTIQVTPASTTTYSIISIKDASSCERSNGFTTPSVTVAVNPAPSAAIVPAASSICRYDSVQLTASGGVSYAWSPGTGLSANNIASPKASPAATTTYKVVVTNANGCKDSATVTITVNQRPTLSLSAPTPSFCPGDSVQLTATGAATYLWTPAAGLSSATAANPKAAPAATTTYQVLGTSAQGCKDSSRITVTRKPAPIVSLSGGGTICAGDSAQLTASGGATYLWSPAATLNNSTIANPKAGPQVTTSYKAVATGANGCKDSSNITVTVNPKPVISLTPAAAAICRFDSTQLVATGGVSYQWVPATGLSNASSASPKASPASTTTYKVIVTNASGCKDSASITVTVHAKPVVTVSPATAFFCPGDSVQLAATGGISYFWAPATGLSNPNIANPHAAPSTSTNYTVTVTNAEGCQSTGTVSLTRKTAPVPVATFGGQVCRGDSAQLQASGGVQYLWSPAASLSNAFVANPKAAPLSTTLYQVVVTNAAGCKDSTILTVPVLLPPAIAITPVNGVICRGDSLQLQASGGSAYQWSPSTGLNHTDIANPKAAPLSTSSYHLLVTGTNGCVDSTDYIITVNARPVINMAASASICQGDSLQLSAQGGGTYSWSPAGGLSNPSISNPKASPASTTDYQVLVTSPQGCVDSSTMTLTVRPKPLIGHTANSTICAGDSLQLAATGGTVYAWSPAATLSNPAIANPKAGPQVSTQYQVVVTGANGCRDSANLSITVNPKPVLTLTASSSICRGDSLQLNASGGATYQWSPGSGLSSTGTSSPKASPLITTTYQVVATTGLGCRDSTTMTLTVKDKPVITVTPRSGLCNGDSLQLNAGGGSSYQWHPASTLSNGLLANPLAFPSDTTRYTVVVTTAAGCIDSANTQVDVFHLPLLFQHHDTLLCTGQTYLADAAVLPGSTSWLWQNGSTSPRFLIDAPGVYWVHSQVTGCHNPVRDSIFVDTLGRPSVTLGPDRDICAYDNFLLGFQGRNISSFAWSNGSTDTAIRITTTGTYSIDVSNRCGTARDEADILVLPCNDELYFPSAFTPNSDGKNDRFKAAHLPGVTVFSYELHVFNRWGEEVFRTSQLNEGWDGTVNGKMQDSNHFVWYVRYRKNPGAAEQFQKGTVLLIR